MVPLPMNEPVEKWRNLRTETRAKVAFTWPDFRIKSCTDGRPLESATRNPAAGPFVIDLVGRSMKFHSN